MERWPGSTQAAVPYPPVHQPIQVADSSTVTLPNKALIEAAAAAQSWAASRQQRAAQPEAVRAGREVESLRSEYGAT